MITLLAILVGLVVGMVLGASCLARWWVWKLKHDEAFMRSVLKDMYARTAHPHWLQLSETDQRRVCPCCGWSETETLAHQHTKECKHE